MIPFLVQFRPQHRLAIALYIPSQLVLSVLKQPSHSHFTFLQPPDPTSPLFSRRTRFHFHRAKIQAHGMKSELLQSLLLIGPQIQLKCNSAPFTSVVDIVCASLNPFRTEGLNVCSRHPLALRPLWGLPQMKRAALPKAMPSS